MDQRAAYLVQILEKIGSPLMESVIEVSEGDAQTCAQMMASMLAKSVQVSIDLGQIMDVNPVAEGDDSLRVALAGIAAPLVAGQARKKKGAPDDADIKRVVSSLQAVLTFSDNFTPSEQSAARLDHLKSDRFVAGDAAQVGLQYVHAFVPVVQAISKFSFGQGEQKLVVDVTKRLVERSENMALSIASNVQGDDSKSLSLSLVSVLATIYAICHETETVKMGGIDAEGASPSLDSVWRAFDMQCAMLETLVQNLVPSAGGPKAEVTEGPVVPAAAASQPVQQVPPVTPPPVQETPVSPPLSQPPQTPPVNNAQAEAGANPMAMFAKPKDDEQPAAAPPVTPTSEAPTAQAPASPVLQPVQQEQSQQTQPAGANPMAMFAKPKDDEQPAAAPPAVPQPEQAEDSSEDASGGETGGGPMSFFKKGD